MNRLYNWHYCESRFNGILQLVLFYQLNRFWRHILWCYGFCMPIKTSILVPTVPTA